MAGATGIGQGRRGAHQNHAEMLDGLEGMSGATNLAAAIHGAEEEDDLKDGSPGRPWLLGPGRSMKTVTADPMGMKARHGSHGGYGGDGSTAMAARPWGGATEESEERINKEAGEIGTGATGLSAASTQASRKEVDRARAHVRPPRARVFLARGRRRLASASSWAGPRLQCWADAGTCLEPIRIEPTDHTTEGDLSRPDPTDPTSHDISCLTLAHDTPSSLPYQPNPAATLLSVFHLPAATQPNPAADLLSPTPPTGHSLAADLLSPSPVGDPSLSFFPVANAETLARQAQKEPDHGDTDRSGGCHGGQARCHGDLARSTGGTQIQQSKVAIGGGCHGPSSSPHAPSLPPFLGDGIGAEEEPALVAQQLPLQRVRPQVPQHQLLSPPPQQDSMSMGTTTALRQVIKSSGRRAGAWV